MFRKSERNILTPELTFKVMLGTSCKWLMDEIVEGVNETLLPKEDESIRFLDGVLLNEKARPIWIRVLDASLKAFDNVPKWTLSTSMPISWEWTLTTNFSCNEKLKNSFACSIQISSYCVGSAHVFRQILTKVLNVKRLVDLIGNFKRVKLVLAILWVRVVSHWHRKCTRAITDVGQHSDGRQRNHLDMFVGLHAGGIDSGAWRFRSVEPRSLFADFQCVVEEN